MRKKTEPNGRCAVCRHADRHRIEVLIAGGASIKSVAKKFGIEYFAAWRHWHHVTDERKAALLAGPVVVKDLAARLADENTSVLDHLRNVRAGLYCLYDAAVAAGDRTGGAMVAGRLHENLNSVARLTGELAQSPLVAVQNNFFVSPEFAQVQAALMRVLASHPEARDDVIRTFRELEGQVPAAKLIEAHNAATA